MLPSAGAMYKLQSVRLFRLMHSSAYFCFFRSPIKFSCWIDICISTVLHT